MAKLYEHFDLAVVGAGGAGLSAAAAAAAGGLKVALLEKEPSLGGGYVQSGMTAFRPVLRGEYLPGLWSLCREKGEYRLMDPQRFQEHGYRLVKKTGIYFMPSAWVHEVAMENGDIRGLSCVTREGSLEIEAELFLDATGDGDLAAMSFVPFTSGREEDGLCLPPYFCFHLTDAAEGFSLSALDYEKGCVKGLRFLPSKMGVTVKMLYAGVASALSAVDRSRVDLELHLMVEEVAKDLRAVPGLENTHVSSFGQRVIFPEGRHPMGNTIMDSRDLCTPTDYEDAILGPVFAPIELPGMEFMENLPIAAAYRFPYRALLPIRVGNLLLSGRCVSATHRAFGSLSAFHMTLATGAAAGMAAVLAKEEGLRLAQVNADRLKKRMDQYGCTSQS